MLRVVKGDTVRLRFGGEQPPQLQVSAIRARGTQTACIAAVPQQAELTKQGAIDPCCPAVPEPAVAETTASDVTVEPAIAEVKASHLAPCVGEAAGEAATLVAPSSSVHPSKKEEEHNASSYRGRPPAWSKAGVAAKARRAARKGHKRKRSDPVTRSANTASAVPHSARCASATLKYLRFAQGPGSGMLLSQDGDKPASRGTELRLGGEEAFKGSAV